MRVLITGGLGFIGSEIAKYYADNNHDVTVLSRTKGKIKNIEPYYSQGKINLIHSSLIFIKKSHINNIDLIFHCASTVDNYNIHNRPFEDVSLNTYGTNSLLEICKQHNPKVQIIYISTFFVNGNPSELPVTDKTAERPLGLYGATKLCAEHICQTYRRVFDMNIKVVRLTNVYGPNEQKSNNKKAAFNRILWDIVNDKEVQIYNNTAIRDFIYIDDVISGLVKVAEKGDKEQLYYISTNDGFKFSNLVEMAINEANSGRIKYIDPPEFHNQVGIGDFWADNTPLKNLGWKQKISLREGIKTIIDYYKQKIKDQDE